MCTGTMNRNKSVLTERKQAMFAGAVYLFRLLALGFH